MSITVQTIASKNHFREPVSAYGKIVAVDSFRVIFEGVLADITGYEVGKTLHNFKDKRGYIFKKVSETDSELQVRNITAGSTTKSGISTSNSFPHYIILKSGQTRSVPTDTTNDPDNITGSDRKAELTSSHFIELREMAEKAQTENMAEEWAMEEAGVFSFSEIPLSGSTVHKKVWNMRWRQEYLFGFAARVLRKYIDPSSVTYSVGSNFSSITEPKVEALMREMRSEFEINARLWYESANANSFNAKYISRKIVFSNKTGNKKTLKYNPGTTFFVAPDATDWANLKVEYRNLLQGFDES